MQPGGKPPKQAGNAECRLAKTPSTVLTPARALAPRECEHPRDLLLLLLCQCRSTSVTTRATNLFRFPGASSEGALIRHVIGVFLWHPQSPAPCAITSWVSWRIPQEEKVQAGAKQQRMEVWAHNCLRTALSTAAGTWHQQGTGDGVGQRGALMYTSGEEPCSPSTCARSPPRQSKLVLTRVLPQQGPAPKQADRAHGHCLCLPWGSTRLLGSDPQPSQRALGMVSPPSPARGASWLQHHAAEGNLCFSPQFPSRPGCFAVQPGALAGSPAPPFPPEHGPRVMQVPEEPRVAQKEQGPWVG